MAAGSQPAVCRPHSHLPPIWWLLLEISKPRCSLWHSHWAHLLRAGGWHRHVTEKSTLSATCKSEHRI
jgi:hypothetical protein